MPFLLGSLAFIAAGMFGLMIGRYITDGDWHTRWRHKCGGHTRYHTVGAPCPACGEKGSGWTQVTMRATLPFGWEQKDT